MAYLKRQKIPKNWPISRKGTKYVVRANFNMKNGIPILIILRDLLKVAQNRKEVKRAIHSKHILLNNKLVKDEKNSCLLFDTLTLVPSKKYYMITLSDKGKFMVEEIKETDTHQKVSKIINKKTLKEKKIQLNLNDGRNFISDIKCKVNDSVLIDFNKNKIDKCLVLKEKSNVFVLAGKHSGAKGIIKKIIPERKMAELDVQGKNINALIKQLIVVE